MSSVGAELSHQIHQTVDPHDDEDAGLRRAPHNPIEDGRDPASGTELRGGRQPHRRPDHEKQRASDLAEHVAERYAGGLALCFREFLSCHHCRVDDRGHQQQECLGLPVQPELREHKREDATDHDPAWKPRVQANEPAGLVVGVDSRDQRIDRCLDEAVGNADNDGRSEEHREARRDDGQERAGNVAERRDPNDGPHAKHIAERTANQDRQAEAPERRTEDPPDLHIVEREQTLDVAHDVPADREGHGGGDQGEATGGEKARLVHGWVTIMQAGRK
jgi:hypothetical protein